MHHFPYQNIITLIIIGFIVGLVARALKPGHDRLGILATTGLGIVGAFLAGYLGNAVGLYLRGSIANFIAAVLGSVLILVLYDLARRKR